MLCTNEPAEPLRDFLSSDSNAGGSHPNAPELATFAEMMNSGLVEVSRIRAEMPFEVDGLADSVENLGL